MQNHYNYRSQSFKITSKHKVEKIIIQPITALFEILCTSLIVKSIENVVILFETPFFRYLSMYL